MTKKDLIDALSEYEDEEEIYFLYPSGDYWGTTLGREVDSIETANVTWSNYHNAYKLVDEDRLDNYEEDEVKRVIVLS